MFFPIGWEKANNQDEKSKTMDSGMRRNDGASKTTHGWASIGTESGRIVVFRTKDGYVIPQCEISKVLISTTREMLQIRLTRIAV